MIKATETEVTRVIIIGYMGSGKTTVGIELAKRVGFAFYDLDWYIESLSNNCSTNEAKKDFAP